MVFLWLEGSPLYINVEYGDDPLHPKRASRRLPEAISPTWVVGDVTERSFFNVHRLPAGWLIKHHLVGGWATPLKNISQLGWLFPIYGKIKNVPNHQPEEYLNSLSHHPHSPFSYSHSLWIWSHQDYTFKRRHIGGARIWVPRNLSLSYPKWLLTSHCCYS